MGRRFLVVLGVALLGEAASAQPENPPDAWTTPECRQALDALPAAEARSAATHGAELPELLAARQRAARACLANPKGGAAPPGRLAQPPLAAPPIPLVRPTTPPTSALPAGALPATVPAPPLPARRIVTCNALNCWTNDGAVLQRSGNNLLGPRGVCTMNGTTLSCP